METSERHVNDEVLSEDRTESSSERPHPDSNPPSPTGHQEGKKSISMGSTAPIASCQDPQQHFDPREGEKSEPMPKSEDLPTKSKLAILIVSACMAIFLQALVSVTTHMYQYQGS